MFKTAENLYVYSIISSVLAFFGFKLNNETAIIGAMILSPILQPTTYYLKSKSSSSRNLSTAFITTFKIALIVFIIGTLMSVINSKIKLYPVETATMKIRLDKREMINDFILAILIGFGVAFAIAENNALARTGLTLGITLIPILTLSGIYFGNYLADKYILNKYDVETDKKNKTNSIKLVIIFLINLIVTISTFTFTTRYIIGN